MSGKECTHERDGLTLFVPVSTRLTTILPSSAVVGTKVADGIAIDFEGDRYNTGMPFETRLAIAAGRHVDRAPTVARLFVRDDDLRPVGTVVRDPLLEAWIVREVFEPQALSDWLSPEPVPETGGSKALHDRAAGMWVNRLPSHLLHEMAEQRGFTSDGILAAARRHMAQRP